MRLIITWLKKYTLSLENSLNEQHKSINQHFVQLNFRQLLISHKLKICIKVLQVLHE